MAESKPKAKHTPLKRILEVSVHRRNEFPTVEAAAAELGLTPNSFKQRMSKVRKAYPRAFDGVPDYRRGGGPRVATEAEALAMLEELRNGSTNDNG